MNKKIIIPVTVFIIIVGLVIAFLIIKGNGKLIIDDKKLNDSYIKLFEVSENSKVYSQFSNIKYKYKKNEYALEEALKDNIVTIEKLMNGAKSKEALNDGGTIIYSFDDYKIIKCYKMNPIENNYIKDIYIVDVNNEKEISDICIAR